MKVITLESRFSVHNYAPHRPRVQALHLLNRMAHGEWSAR